MFFRDVNHKTTRKYLRVFVWDYSGQYSVPAILENIGLVMERSDWLILVIVPLN